MAQARQLTELLEVGQVAVLVEKDVVEHQELGGDGESALVGVWIPPEDRQDLVRERGAFNFFPDPK